MGCHMLMPRAHIGAQGLERSLISSWASFGLSPCLPATNSIQATYHLLTSCDANMLRTLATRVSRHSLSSLRTIR